MVTKIDSNALRTFVYINTNMVNDYLSSIGQNYVVTKKTERADSANSIGVDKVLVANKGNAKSIESSKELRSLESAGFNQLYSLLETNDLIEYHETFNTESWESINRRDILDTFVQIRLPNFLELADSIHELQSVTEKMPDEFQKTGLDEKIKAAIPFLNNSQNEKLDIVMNLVDDNNYKFYSKIFLEYLKVDRSQLSDEYNVVGKIKKKITDGNPKKLSIIQPFLDSFGKLNFPQDQLKTLKMPQGFEEVIEYPAAELDIIAIYS